MRAALAALAREIGVVPQGEEIAFPIGVREMVAMGRYPHLGSWRREGDEDRLAIEEAKAQMAQLQQMRPGFTLGRFRAVEPSDTAAFRAQRERVYEGLRRAGYRVGVRAAG